jgi:hypothetical protein
MIHTTLYKNFNIIELFDCKKNKKYKMSFAPYGTLPFLAIPIPIVFSP